MNHDKKVANRLNKEVQSLEKLIVGPLTINSGGASIDLDINNSSLLDDVQEVLRKHLQIKKEEFDKL